MSCKDEKRKEKRRKDLWVGDGKNLNSMDRSSMHLPEDLVINILLRLPILICFRFRTVCKSWYSLLSDPVFMYKNLTLINSLDEDEDNQLLIKHTNFIACRNYFSLISYDNLNHYIPLTLDEQIENSPLMTVVGCSNGLVCLTDGVSKIFIWNPSTKETKVLPQSPLYDPDDYSPRGFEVGFFFDDKTDDYKVVQILHTLAGGRGGNKVESYSFRSDSWKQIDYPCQVYLHSHGTPINFDGQFYHWLAMDDEYFPDTQDLIYYHHVIVSFDVNVELFKSSVIPCTTSSINIRAGWYKNIFIRLFMLKKFVAVCTSPCEAAEPVYEILVLLKVGVEESWVKLISVGPLSLQVEGILGCWKYGKLLLQTCKGELIIFDPFTREIIPLPSNGTPSSNSDLQILTLII